MLQWEVAASVLHILYKLLERHEVMFEDFVEQQVELAGEGVITLNKPPGYSIMLHMLNDTPMLKMVGKCVRIIGGLLLSAGLCFAFLVVNMTCVWAVD